MRTRTLALVASTAFASAAPLVSASAATPAPVAATVRTYHQMDSGRTVTAFVGKPFKVRLEVCGDCGSSLKLVSPNTRVLHLVRRSITSTAKPPAVGGEEFETWTFEAKNAGKATIRITKRSAEQGGKVSPRFHLTVKVSTLVVDN
jgi:predicted secreted protein